jgi:hypothetical protein
MKKKNQNTDRGSQTLTHLSSCLGVSTSLNIPRFQCAGGRKVVASIALMVSKVAYNRYSSKVFS